jgi:hypothetical protein
MERFDGILFGVGWHLAIPVDNDRNRIRNFSNTKKDKKKQQYLEFLRYGGIDNT